MNIDSPILARRTPTGLDVRNEAARINWTIPDASSSDSHALTVRFSCSVIARPEKAERTLLFEAIPHSRDTITAADVGQLLRQSIESACNETISSKPAQYWMTSDGRTEMKEGLHRAISAKAFACGLEALPPFDIEIESPSMRRQQRVAGHVQHLSKLSELLAKFESMKATGVSAGEILRQFSQDDQSAIVQDLLRVAGERDAARFLWCVAGSKLLKLDLSDEKPQHSIMDLPTALGPLRSVSVDDGKLLIGARAGVMQVDPQSPESPEVFPAGGIDSKLGFSRVLRWQGQIVAAHSEAGLFSWNTAEPEPHKLAEGGVRWLNRLGDGVAYAHERQMVFRHGSEVFNLNSVPVDDLAEIFPWRDRLLLIRRGGSIMQIDSSGNVATLPWRVPGGVTSAALMPWMDEHRLLVALESGSLLAGGLDDDVIQHYPSAHRGMRMLRGSRQYIVAVPEDRQRVILWRPWESKPAHEIHVTAVTGHRVADVNFE